MTHPNNESIPYLKGLLTLSVLSLIYVYGQAEIKSTLTISLVGLEINHPEVIGNVIFVTLIWYTIRFWRTGILRNSWNFQTETKLIIVNGLTRQEPYIQELRRVALRALAPEDFPIEQHDQLNFSGGEFNRRNRKITAHFPPPYLPQGSCKRYANVDLKIPLWLRMEIHALVIWIFDRDNLTHHYLPLFLSIFALMSALTSIGLNPFQGFIS